MSREVNWQTVFFNIREACGELDGLREDLREAEKKDFDAKSCVKHDLCEARLSVALFHIYHHLNSAWGARFRPTPEADRTFHANEKWPVSDEFRRFWPRKAWARMR